MSRRQVTMLEAFQASARDAAERAAAERRQLIADREKEMRREEATRTAEDFRLWPRKGARAAKDRSGDDLAVESSNPVDSASRAAPVPASIATAAAAPGSAGADAAAGPDPPGERTAFGRAPELDSLAHTAALDETLFTLPVTARGFILLQGVLLGAVFFVGWTLGGQGSAAAAPTTRTASMPGGPSGSGPEIRSLGSRAGARADGFEPGQQLSHLRTTVASTVATVTGAPAAGPQSAGPQSAGTAGEDYTAADRAFRDPLMKFTVLAITYTSTESNVARAWETYDLLRAQGLPAVRPVGRGDRIYLFVDAAEDRALLADTEARLHALRSGQSNSHEFRSAYKVNIEPYR